ncbi:MAG: HEWD family protein [Halobacteriales archaeon]
MPPLSPPRERTCERCGRRDRWDEATSHWTIAVERGEARRGDPFCIHEWDVTGDYNPFEE